MQIELNHQCRVSLVQMPNGTGKTTTLICLRAALTGEAQQWSPDKVRRFAPREASDGKGEFEVSLEVDAKPLTLLMKFDFSSGEVTYATTFRRGQKKKYDPPPELRRFLTPYFVQLLIFDGELPHELLDRTKARAKEALNAFFQIYLLQEVRTAIEDIWERATEKKTATEVKGLSRRQNRVKKRQKKVRELEQARKAAEAKHSKLSSEVEKLRTEKRQYLQQTEEIRGQQDELEFERQTASSKLEAELRQLMDAIRKPHLAYPGFSSSLVELREQLDRLRLPESTSAQFFEELSEEETCICGRPLDDETRGFIREQANRYMGADTFGVINSLKTDIAKFESSGTKSDTREQAHNVTEVAHQRDQIQTQIDGLAQMLINRGDEQLAQIHETLKNKEEELEELTSLIEEVTREKTDDDDKTTMCLEWWKAELSEAEQLLAEITDTLALRRHRDILMDILDDAMEEARRRISESVVEDMNERLDSLLPGHEIHVARIDQSLILDRQGGASQGQTLAVGYSFLTTLFKRGQHEFPFLVDAPVIALDSRVRREVARVIPQVCPQFAALVLDTEREGFVDELSAAAEDDVLYLTAFEDSPRNAALAAQVPEEGVKRTEQSIVVEGREYFMNAAFPEKED